MGAGEISKNNNKHESQNPERDYQTHLVLASSILPGFLEDGSSGFDAAGPPGKLHVLDEHLWVGTKRGPSFKSKCTRHPPGNELANQRRIHVLALEELSIDGLGLAIVEITLRKRHIIVIAVLMVRKKEQHRMTCKESRDHKTGLSQITFTILNLKINSQQPWHFFLLQPRKL